MKFSMTAALDRRKDTPQQMQAWRLSLVKQHLRYAGGTPFYRQSLKQAGIVDPEEIRSWKDFQQLPLTNRQMLESHFQAIQAVPDQQIADFSLTSGTTGTPLVIPFTRRDLDRLAFNEAVAFYGATFRPGERYLLFVTQDRCFIAGIAYFTGLTRLGATAIRSGPGLPGMQWELIQHLQPVGIIGVPSALLELAHWGQDHGYNAANSTVRTLLAIGEPVRRYDHTPTMLGQAVATIWNASVYSTYATTEVQTCFCECQAHKGGHVHPELAYVEILDAVGQSLPDGEPGEVVITPLGVEGFPLVRFCTGDVARIFREPCSCGWNTPRLSAIEGRLKQRLKVKGTTLYPETIFATLQEIAGIGPAYVEVNATYDLSDEVCVTVGSDSTHVQSHWVAEQLQARLRVRLKVQIQPIERVKSHMMQKGGRKPQNFFDLRKKVKPVTG